MKFNPTPRPVRWSRIISAAIFSLSLCAAEFGFCADTLAALDKARGTEPSALLYVGVNGEGLRALRFNPGSGQLAAIGNVANSSKARWGVAHPGLPVVYISSDNGPTDGKVTAYAVDRASGALQFVNEQSSGGRDATHLQFDARSNTLLMANYGGGSVSSMAVNVDGSVGALVSNIQHQGSGPHRRQSSPHAHGVFLDASGKHVLALDLGTDRIYDYAFDAASRKLTPNESRAFVAPAGSGPRHLVFGKDQQTIYLLTELTAELLTLRWNAQEGTFTTLQTLPTSSAQFAGTKSASEILISLDGRFVYVGNRGENQLQVYAVNAQSGELALIQSLACGGENPWTFVMHASGRWLLVANERSNRVNVFSVDAASGKLADTGISAESPAPISLTFVD